MADLTNEQFDLPGEDLSQETFDLPTPKKKGLFTQAKEAIYGNPDQPPVPEGSSFAKRFEGTTGLIPKAFTPFVTLPSAPEIPDITTSKVSTFGPQVGAAAYNILVKGIAEPLMSPGGIATLGAGVAAKGVGALGRGANLGLKALSGLFLPQAVGTIKEGLEAPTTQQRLEKLVGGSLLGVGALKGLQGVAPRVRPVEPVVEAKAVPPVSPLEGLPTEELNEPLPTPWLATDTEGKYTVPAKTVRSEAKARGLDLSKEAEGEVRKQLDRKTRDEVDRVRLQQQDNPNLASDTPDFAARDPVMSNDNIELLDYLKSILEKPKEVTDLSKETFDIPQEEAGKKITEQPLEKETYATESKRPLSEEHTGISSGEDLPKNPEEVRKEESKPASDSSSLLSEGKGLVDQGIEALQGESGASISLLQRKLKIPYNDAVSLMSELEKRGVVGPDKYPKAREIIKGKGLDIKINPAAGELGGIDLSVIHEAATKLYDIIKDKAKWTEDVLNKFPADIKVLPAAKDYANTLWTKLQAGELQAPLLKSDINRLLDLGPLGRRVSKAANEAYIKYREFHGKYVDEPIRKLRHLVGGPSTPEAKRVLQYMNDIQDNGKSDIVLTPDEKAAVDVIQHPETGINPRVRAEANKRPGLHGGKTNFDYIQKGFDRRALDEITQRPESAESKRLEKVFIEDRVKRLGDSVETAKKDFEAIKKGFSKTESSSAEQFGPLDRASGKGLPPEFRSKNLFDLVTHYGDRVSRRLAYHDAIESNPQVTEALKVVGATKPWQRVFRELSGQHNLDDTVMRELLATSKAGMIGTATGLNNLVNAHYLGWPQFTWKQIATTTIKSYSGFKDNWARTYKNGINRDNFASLEFGDGGLTATLDRIRAVRNFTNKAVGKDALEKTARTVNMGMGRINTVENFEAARIGKANTTQFRWLDNYGERENWRQYLKEGRLPEDVIDRMASLFVESVQATYDSRTQTYRALGNSNLSPFLSLSRWSIDRSNRFLKETVTPLVNGDIQPALKATLLTIVGAEAVDEINKLVTKRRNTTPTFKEIAAAKDQGADVTSMYFYKLASLVSLSSAVGIYGDLFKTAFDVAYKNRPREINNPAFEMGKNILHTIFDIQEAHSKGELDAGDIPDIISHVLENNLQNWRVLQAQFSTEKQQEIDRANKNKTLRIYKQLKDEPVSDLTGGYHTNPYINKDVKKFKTSLDPAEISEAHKAILTQLATQAQSGKLTEKQLEDKLKGLKNIPYNTFPNPSEDLEGFTKYTKFLVDTVGREETTKMLQDYFKNQEVNKIKKELIP